jgi:hypothetical protein
VTKLSDGGYFESSGVATALDLAHSLKTIIDQRPDLKSTSSSSS